MDPLENPLTQTRDSFVQKTLLGGPTSRDILWPATRGNQATDDHSPAGTLRGPALAAWGDAIGVACFLSNM